jgi:hypothetical protein
VEGSSGLQWTALTDGDDGGDSGDGGAAAPVVGEEDGGVGAMRRSKAEVVVGLLELGDGADVEGEAKQSPVLCSSGGWRTSSGSSLL